jgi:hypothetical protein
MTATPSIEQHAPGAENHHGTLSISRPDRVGTHLTGSPPPRPRPLSERCSAWLTEIEIQTPD